MILPGYQTSDSASSSKFHHLALLALLALLVALVSRSSNFHHWPLLALLVALVLLTVTQWISILPSYSRIIANNKYQQFLSSSAAAEEEEWRDMNIQKHFLTLLPCCIPGAVGLILIFIIISAAPLCFVSFHTQLHTHHRETHSGSSNSLAVASKVKILFLPLQAGAWCI